jgi:subtilisin family serine protease
MSRITRIACVSLLAAAPSFAADDGKIAPRLAEVLAGAAPDERIPVVVMMEEFPAKDALLAEVRGLLRAPRRARVMERLRPMAEESRHRVLATLFGEDAGDAGDGRRVRALWGIHGVSLAATPREIEKLARMEGVGLVFHDHGESGPGSDPADPPDPGTRDGFVPDKRLRRGDGPTGGDASGPNPEASVRPEVIAMGAPQVWEELGYTGNGVIVAVVDTGIDRTHPDLADHIWTNLGEVPANGVDDDGNGYVDDTWGWDFCLDNNDPSAGSHGTQVAGQVAGDGTDGTVTGMAPDAELMSLGIDCDTPSRGWEASDYAIAHGAHVITQSYSWWWSDQPDYEAFRRQTDTELAAGVIHVNSAGNDALNPYPIPYNISTPANAPAPWLHPDQTIVGGVSSIIAAGNISWTTDLIDPSSSLGPSAWEDIRTHTDPGYPYGMAPEYQDYPYENGAQTGLIKPDVSAYGSGTTSTCPGPFYCGFSGTSSAAPHISGTIALMLEANPEATPAQLAEILMTTAEHRGGPGKNNVYGAGLVQTYAAVAAVESGIVYVSHVFDDTADGNGDLELDPGETVRIVLTVESRSDFVVDDLEAFISTDAPGVVVHDNRAVFPALAVGGTAESAAPHFSVGIEPDACAGVAVFDVELRYGGSVRRLSFAARIGTEEPITLLDDDFESAWGWTSDPGTTTRGAWVREDPIGVMNDQGVLANPEDDTTPAPGTVCWVTGNGELSGRNDENNNDVDDGSTTLLSPLFGVPHILELSLAYDRWYYDDSSGGDSFRADFSNDGGASWAPVELTVNGNGGWSTQVADLLLLLPASEAMQLRFVVTDGAEDTAVEGALDEVRVDGTWVSCQDHVPAAAQPPNPVGDTLLVDRDATHVSLSWQPPPIDAGHDGATLYRVVRATSPTGPFVEVGSPTSAGWYDQDAAPGPELFFYRVSAENAGGPE